MAYRLAGTYVAGCNCRVICPCPVDQTPTGPGDECRGAAAFRIDSGNLDDVDLSGVSFGLVNYFPSNISAGNWTVATFVDESASDDQAQALERILSGSEGGPFGDFAALISEARDLERGRVTVSENAGSIGGVGDIQFEPFTGPDGSPTRVRSAMFGFAPEYTIGKASGRGEVLGESIEMSYGESAQFEFTSESTDVRPRA